MDDRREEEPLGGDPLPPPPEPPPLPEQPLGPPSMADDTPPPGQPPPAYPPPPAAAPPGAAPPGYPPPAQAPPGTAPPGYPPPGAAPPGAAPPVYPPPQSPPPLFPPPGPAQPQPGYQPPAYQPPPYQPPPPAQRGPHGQPVFKGMETASWGTRVGAYLLDILFAIVLPAIASIPLLASGVTGLEIAGGILLGGSLLFFFPLYSAILEARGGEHQGQTFGKQIVDIRVVRDNGERIGFGFGLLRELVVRWGLIGLIGVWFFFPPFLDLLWPLWDESNRTLHDMVVSTHVVYAQDAPGGVPGGTTPGAGTAGLPG